MPEVINRRRYFSGRPPAKIARPDHGNAPAFSFTFVIVSWQTVS